MSLNHMCVSLSAFHIWGCRAIYEFRQRLEEVKKRADSGRVLESLTREGDSPVDEIREPSVWSLSTAGPENSRGNLGEPSSKAIYYLATDSELVP